MESVDRDVTAAGDPSHVGRWLIHGRIGAGAMGVVYLGDDGSESCAVKVIRPDLADDPSFRARFRREVVAARRVSNRYVAKVIEADPDDQLPWMASEFVDGPSLDVFVRENGILEADALVDLAVALAEGLEAIHVAGIVHRDLKPSNVLIAPDGPRIVDFGVAHTAAATTLTATGLVLGSPA
jgi:eukaryotic-like serine/threonine-protein kinase